MLRVDVLGEAVGAVGLDRPCRGDQESGQTDPSLHAVRTGAERCRVGHAFSLVGSRGGRRPSGASARVGGHWVAAPPPVNGIERQCLEDQKVDAAAEGIGLGGVAGGHGRLLSLEVERRIGHGSLEVKR